MSTEQNKATAQRLYDEVLNQENKAVIDELFAADVIIHDPFMGTLEGVEGFKQLLAMFDAAFPHHRAEVQQIVAEGDFVTILHVHTGQHAGSFMGMPPTGKAIRISGVEVMRLRNGQIVEFWRHDDDAGLLMQLGVIQAPAPA